jgi:hypothetical protein
MKRTHAKQLTMALSLIAPFVLAAAVFLWGSEYKCSLYHRHPDKGSRIAIAKLLSERERRMPAAVAVVHAPLSDTAFFALGLALDGLSRRAQLRFEQALPTIRKEDSAGSKPCLIHFPFRPPPPAAA